MLRVRTQSRWIEVILQNYLKKTVKEHEIIDSKQFVVHAPQIRNINTPI